MAYFTIKMITLASFMVLASSSNNQSCRHVTYHVEKLHQVVQCTNDGVCCCGNGKTKLKQGGKCPDDYVASHNSSCYKFYIINSNWYQSVLNCRAEGASLVSIETPEEDSYLKHYINKTHHLRTVQNGFWTSGTDLAREGNWMWWSTLKMYSYGGWKGVQPDNYKQNEHCMHLHISTPSYVVSWNDWPCNLTAGHICEKMFT